MVTEKPPRRSKVEKDPVTIDLTPEEQGLVAEPVRSNDADKPVTATATDAALDSAPVPTDAVAATYSISDEPLADAAGQPTIATTDAEEPPVKDYPRFDDADRGSEPPAFENRVQPAPVDAQKSSPAASTLIAAGIFGGIVALLLAGSMQYAGFLPGTSVAPAADTSALSGEMAELRQEIRALGARPAATDAGLAGRIQALEAATSQGNGSADLSERLTAIERQIGEIKSATQATASSDADLSRRLERAETKINDRGPEQQVARAVTAAALKAAIDRGGVFDPELQAYASLAGDDPAVAGLKPFAQRGVPSRAELQREFPSVADAVIEASAAPDPDQGIGSRLLSSAMSVVKVRRVGDVEGDTPEAIVARMEQNLQSGDLQASIREWETLPEPAKAASRDFRQKLDARLQVENLVGGTLARALAGTQG